MKKTRIEEEKNEDRLRRDLVENQQRRTRREVRQR